MFESLGIVLFFFIVLVVFVYNGIYKEPRYSARLYVVNTVVGMAAFLGITVAMSGFFSPFFAFLVTGVALINAAQVPFCGSCGALQRRGRWKLWPTSCARCKGTKFVRLWTALRRDTSDPVAKALSAPVSDAASTEPQRIAFVVGAKSELDAHMIAGALRTVHNVVIEIDKVWWPGSRRWRVTALTESMSITRDSTREWVQATAALLAPYDGVLRHWAPR